MKKVRLDDSLPSVPHGVPHVQDDVTEQSTIIENSQVLTEMSSDHEQVFGDGDGSSPPLPPRRRIIPIEDMQIYA
jgi:hypothetical protein